MRAMHSPSIRSRYDYFNNIAPTQGLGGSAGPPNFYDNHPLGSLFGEPVLPSPTTTGYLDTTVGTPSPRDNNGNVYAGRRGSNVSSSYSNFLSPRNVTDSNGNLLPFIADGYGMQTGLNVTLVQSRRSSFGSTTVPRTRSAVANDFRSALDSFE